MELIDDVETWVREDELAEKIGVRLDALRDARSQLPDEFVKKEGRRWMVSPAGAERLAAAFADTPAVLTLETEKKDAGDDLDAADDLFDVVAKKIPANPHLVLGEWMGQPVRVRVKDSKKFVPGMRMKCRLVEGDIMALVGRGPRFKGRW
jgi:hypothetical protein